MSEITSEADALLEKYLKQVRGGLRQLPPEEAEDILQELRSHVLDRISDAAEPRTEAVKDALAALGNPDQVASQYLTEYSLAMASSSLSPWKVFRSLVRWATINIIGFVVLVLSIFSSFFGLNFLILAVLKLFIPNQVGLWMSAPPSSHLVAFGILTSKLMSAMHAHEVLGWWMVPLGLILGTALLVGTLQFDIWCIRRYQRYLAKRRFR